MTLTTREALEEVSYNPRTGDISRKSATGRRSGSRRKDGYVRISVGGKQYLAHRLAWFLHFGQWPKGQIDHINGIRDDNRIVNLRDVTHAQNCQNASRKPRDLPRGVYQYRSRYMASISVQNRSRHLGVFDTPEQAERAYKNAAAKYHGEFAYTERAAL